MSFRIANKTFLIRGFRVYFLLSQVPEQLEPDTVKYTQATIKTRITEKFHPVRRPVLDRSKKRFFLSFLWLGTHAQALQKVESSHIRLRPPPSPNM